MKRTKSKRAIVPDELDALLYADVIRDLSLEESGAGKIAREILRAERDGREDEVKHLVEPLARAIFQAVPKVRRKDPHTGRWTLDIELPAAWRA